MNFYDYFTSIEVAICFTALFPAACLIAWLTYDEFTNGW
jgi:hypothetical protein